jgi:outer membrane protein assembly factor BamB
MGVPPPGWRDDGTGRERYWNGVSWSDRGPDGAGPPGAADDGDLDVVPVVVVGVSGVVVALDLTSGKVLWEHPLPGSGGRIDLEMHAGRVFAAAAASGAAPIVCLDQATGVLQWSTTFEEPGADPPGLFLAGGHLLVHGQALVACYSLDGERLWDHERPGDHWLTSGGTAQQSWAVALADRVHRLYPTRP